MSLEMDSLTSFSALDEDEIFLDFIVIENARLKKQRRRSWVRKAPMISKGMQDQEQPRANSISKKLLDLGSSVKSNYDDLYQELRQNLVDFINSVTKSDWKSTESFKRFYIFGEHVTCTKWKGQFYITSQEIFRIQRVLYRLEFKETVSRPKRFEESILTQLRSLKDGADLRIEETGSELIEFLFKIGAIRTRKRQKIFYWDAINHEKIFKERESQQTVRPPKCLEPSKPRKSSYTIKSIVLFSKSNKKIDKEKSGIDDLISAINTMEEGPTLTASTAQNALSRPNSNSIGHRFTPS